MLLPKQGQSLAKLRVQMCLCALGVSAWLLPLTSGRPLLGHSAKSASPTGGLPTCLWFPFLLLAHATKTVVGCVLAYMMCIISIVIQKDLIFQTTVSMPRLAQVADTLCLSVLKRPRKIKSYHIDNCLYVFTHKAGLSGGNPIFKK